jgi:hypothetical protein
MSANSGIFAGRARTTPGGQVDNFVKDFTLWGERFRQEPR